MPSRDSRDRVAEAATGLFQKPPYTGPLSVEEAAKMTPEEVEAAEEDARNPQLAGGTEGKFTHELPLSMRDPRYQTEFWTAKGLSDSEAILITNTLRQQNGGLVEYDEEAEAERLAKARERQMEISRVDGGSSVQAQLSAVEAYFVGAVPRGDGRYCERLPYMSPRDEKVWINGYHFSIPKHTRVLIPREVIDLLDSAAKSRGDFEIVSAAFQARQFDPINMHEGVIPTAAEMAPRTLDYFREPRNGPFAGQ